MSHGDHAAKPHHHPLPPGHPSMDHAKPGHHADRGVHGERLHGPMLDSRYTLRDWDRYGFPPPMPGGRWQRHHDGRFVLVDRDGYVVDSRPGPDRHADAGDWRARDFDRGSPRGDWDEDARYDDEDYAEYEPAYDDRPAYDDE